MTKRPGRRERAKMRKAQADKQSIIAHNMASPREASYLPKSPAARLTLLTHSHAGFRDPKGGLAKARVERVHIDGHRFEFIRAGARWGGADNQRDMRSLWAQYRDRGLACKVVDTRPWLDETGEVAELIEKLNYRVS